MLDTGWLLGLWVHAARARSSNGSDFRPILVMKSFFFCASSRFRRMYILYQVSDPSPKWVHEKKFSFLEKGICRPGFGGKKDSANLKKDMAGKKDSHEER